ncbi:MAG: MAPEG family protein [Hyphomicrobiales bacterium]
MQQTIIMLAMLGQVLLTFGLYARLLRLRVAYARSTDGRTKVDIKRVVLGQESWPDSVVQNEAAVKNQFEAPTLFFAACILSIAAGLTSIVFAMLAVIFVAFRAWHASIHIGNNELGPRIKAFSSSLFTVVAMWILLVGHQLYRQITT